MFFFAVLIFALMGGLIYAVFVLMEVPGMAEERLGEIEPLPEHLNQWMIDSESDAGKAALARGLQRETRLWHDPAGGFLGTERLLRQTRVRNPRNDEIESVERDQPYRRRRIKKKP